jgi:hypothetical protein
MIELFTHGIQKNYASYRLYVYVTTLCQLHASVVSDEFRRKRSWCILKFCECICLECMRKTKKFHRTRDQQHKIRSWSVGVESIHLCQDRVQARVFVGTVIDFSGFVKKTIS